MALVVVSRKEASNKIRFALPPRTGTFRFHRNGRGLRETVEAESRVSGIRGWGQGATEIWTYFFM